MPVNTQHKLYQKYLPLWKKCHDAFEGEESVHKAGTLYLPALQDQPQADYDNYVKRASFYNATCRTIVGMVGMVFRQPPLVDVPAALLPLLDNIDCAGGSLATEVLGIVTSILVEGHVGVLIDAPELTEVLTIAKAEVAGIRPTWATYTAENIINWREGVINNIRKLTLVVLRECIYDNTADEFEPEERVQYRVLDLVAGVYSVRTYVAAKSTLQSLEQKFELTKTVFPTINGVGLDFIPFMFLGAKSLTPKLGLPPLLDLVDINFSHYRTTADLEHGAHFAAIPTLFVSGYHPDNESKPIYVGSTMAQLLDDPAARAEYVEVHGPGFQTLITILDRKEKQMAVIGSRMLELASKNVDSAERASIHRKGEESILSTLAQTVSRGVVQLLRWYAQWAGISGEIRYALNKDFYPVPLDAPTLAALVQGWQAGAYSEEVLFENLKKGEIINEGDTFEMESARLKQVPVALKIAQENAKGASGSDMQNNNTNKSASGTQTV